MFKKKRERIGLVLSLLAGIYVLVIFSPLVPITTLILASIVVSIVGIGLTFLIPITLNWINEGEK